MLDTMVGHDVLELLRPIVASPDVPEEADVTGSAYDEYMCANVHDTMIHKRSAAKQFVQVHAQSMARVFAMVIGIPDYEGILEQKPFSLEKRKDHTKVFKPTNEQLIKEIFRRAYFFEKDFKTDNIPNPNVNKRGITKQPEPAAWKTPKLTAWLKDRPLKIDQKDKAFCETSIATYSYTTTLAESQQERSLLLEESNKSKSAKTKLPDNGYSSEEDDKCLSVASDATSSKASVKISRRRQHPGLEVGLFTEEAKKIRKLWTTSTRGDGIRSSIHSLVVEQSTMMRRLTALEDREAEDTRNFHTYTLKLCNMMDSNADNDNTTLAQQAMTRIVDSICADRASVNSEIASMRANAAALGGKLVAKEQLLLDYENGSLET
jgi:hypothetical protein